MMTKLVLDNIIRLATSCVIWTCLVQPAVAANSSLQASTGCFRGFASYQIGGLVTTDNLRTAFHFPISELKFPVNLYATSIGIVSQLNDRWRLELWATKNLGPNSGKLEDSDWLRAASMTADIFSESETSLDLLTAQVKLLYHLRTVSYSDNNQLQFNWGWGYRHQYYYFEASDLHQWYPADPERGHIYSPGRVITYSLTNKIPYWQFGALKSAGAGMISVNYYAAPYLEVNDRDDHLLRSKLAVGGLTGQAEFWELAFQHPITRHLYWQVRYNYQFIQASGRQEQSRYADTSEGKAGPIATLDQKNISRQSTLLLSLNYQPNPGLRLVPANSIRQSPVKVVVGFSCLYPLTQREACFGPQLELETPRVILGLSFFQGNNKVQTLSKGSYTMVPAYIMWKQSPLSGLNLLAGAGYCFNSNKIDPQAVSALAAKGFHNARETILSSPIFLTGVEVEAPHSQGAVKCSLRYLKQTPTIIAQGDGYCNIQEIDLGCLTLAARIAF